MVSSPPSTRTRLLLFGIFAVVVAVVTFLVLYTLKPYDSPRPAPEQEPTITEEPGDALAEALAEAPLAEAREKPDSPSAEPATARPEKAAAPEKPFDDEEKPEPPAAQPAATAVADGADAKPTVGSPESLQKQGGWQLTIKATGEVKSKHFTLKDPPRLAIDFLKAAYSGEERLLDSPIPAISRIRVGEKPDYTRYVIDFSGDKFPKYEVVHEKEAVLVTITD